MRFNKPGLIFAFVSAYAITAFAWWTYAHIRSAAEIYELKVQILELESHNAMEDICNKVGNKILLDSTAIVQYFQAHYPKHNILFSSDTAQHTLLNRLDVTPKEHAFQALLREKSTDKWMYGTEGAVMVLLLIWGIIWIYGSLQSRINFNRRQNNFMLTITHELKTPLASVKLYLETMQKRQLDKEQTATIIRNSIIEVNRLGDLVDNILMASQLESNNFELQKVEINISKLVNRTIDAFATPRQLTGRMIKEIEENIFVQTDEQALESVLINLLSNAVKYSPSNKQINITLQQAKDHVVLSIKDHGPGISDGDKANIFKKFYRIGDERTRQTKGSGLGLFIVKNLLNLLDARIYVKDNQPSGTIFEMHIDN